MELYKWILSAGGGSAITLILGYILNYRKTTAETTKISADTESVAISSFKQVLESAMEQLSYFQNQTEKLQGLLTKTETDFQLRISEHEKKMKAYKRMYEEDMAAKGLVIENILQRNTRIAELEQRKLQILWKVLYENKELPQLKDKWQKVELEIKMIDHEIARIKEEYESLD